MPKKAASGSGNIRKKTVNRNGKEYTFWEGRVTVGTNPGTGKQIQRSISGKTQKEVAQKIKALSVQIDSGTYISPCKFTLGTWAEMWLSEYLGGVKPLTAGNYTFQVRKHIVPALGAVRLEELKPHTIQNFYNNLTKEGLSPKTVKNIHGVLHGIIKQAVANGYIRTNPTEACVLPKITKAEISPLDSQQIAAFMAALADEPYKNLFTVALFTGMRQSEIIGLSWEQVDFNAGTITVSQQLQRKDNVYFISTPKNGKARTVTPAHIVMDALREERKKQLENRLLAGELWDNPHNLVFTDEIGRNFVRRTVVKHFKALAAKIGTPDARFHDLRHSYAVTALQAGDDIKTVQENLGHATAAFTLDVYGHVTEQMKQASADRMQHFIDNLKKA